MVKPKKQSRKHERMKTRKSKNVCLFSVALFQNKKNDDA